MVWDSIISAGSSLLGGILQNNASNKQATRQMAFQERMARNAHQYEVEDLRAAGLNPILSAKYGGAHVPPGASAPVSDVIGPAVNSALASKRTSAEVANMEEMNKNLREQNKKTQSDTALNDALRDKAVEDAKLSATSAKNVAANTRIVNANASEAEVRKAAFDVVAPYLNSAKDSAKKEGFLEGLFNKMEKMNYPNGRPSH